MALISTGYPNLYLDAKSGIYQVRKMVNGRPVVRSTHVTTRKTAESRCREIIKAIEEGVFTKSTKTLNEWWKIYRKTAELSSKTWATYGYLMEPILVELGNVRLNDITTGAIDRCLRNRRHAKNTKQTVSQATLDTTRGMLIGVFETAIENDLMERNPAKQKRKKTNPRVVRQRVLSLPEQERLEANLSPDMVRFLRFLLGTGLRLDEVRNIDPAVHIDPVGKSVTVTGKGQKTRTVPLLKDELLDIVREQVEENNRPGHRTDRSGTLWGQRPQVLRQMLALGAKKAKIAHLTPHMLRHTFATRYLAGGGDIYIVSKILGHASVAVTERVYAHLLKDDLARLSAGVKLDIAPVVPFTA